MPVDDTCFLIRLEDGGDVAFTTGIHYGLPSLAPFAFGDAERANKWLQAHGGEGEVTEYSLPEAMDVLSRDYTVTGIQWEDRPGHAVVFATDLQDAGELWPTLAVEVGPSGLLTGTPFVSTLTRRGRHEERSAAELVRWVPWGDLDSQWSDVLGDAPLFGTGRRLELLELRLQGGQYRVSTTEVLGPWSATSGTRVLFTSESAARWWWANRAPNHQAWVYYEPARGTPDQERPLELVPVSSIRGLLEEDAKFDPPSVVVNPDCPRGLTGYITTDAGDPVLTSVSGEWAIGDDNATSRINDMRTWSGYGTVHMPFAGHGSRLVLGALGRSVGIEPLGESSDDLRGAARSELSSAISDALRSPVRYVDTSQALGLATTFAITGWDTITGDHLIPIGVSSFLDGARWILDVDEHDRSHRIHGAGNHGFIGLPGSEDEVAEELRSASLRRVAEETIHEVINRGYRPQDADRLLAAANQILTGTRIDAFGYLADLAFRADAVPGQLEVLTHPDGDWTLADLDDVARAFTPEADPEGIQLLSERIGRDIALLDPSSTASLAGALLDYRTRGGSPMADYSPVTVQVSKALEIELVSMLEPFRREGLFEPDGEADDDRELQAYLAGGRAPTLGAFRHLLKQGSTPVHQALNRYVAGLANGKLLSSSKFRSQLSKVAERYRNPAAHDSLIELPRAEKCLEELLGSEQHPGLILQVAEWKRLIPSPSDDGPGRAT